MIDLEKSLTLLNEELSKFDERINLVICGGALLVLSEISNRATRDIDFLSPKMSDNLNKARNAVAKRLGYEENWLNDHAKAFESQIPSGWIDRVIHIKSYSHLRIKGISRQDLISSKLKAVVDRDFDLEDLISLKPSRNEYKIAKAFVESFDLNTIEIFDLKQAEESIFDKE
jgi:hypothetical protein